MTVTRIIFCLIFLFFTLNAAVCSAYAQIDGGILKTRSAIILYADLTPLAGKEIADIFLKIKQDLETTFKWRLNFKPTIVLIRSTKKFQETAKNPRIIAMAFPLARRIIIDYEKMNKSGTDTLAVTLKHEVCHLLIHHYIKSPRLPKWIDEGVCQWASEGISEMDFQKSSFALTRAVVTNRLISLRSLHYSFPKQENDLILAYAQSLSAVRFIRKEFGHDGLLNLLKNLSGGYTLDMAVQKSLLISAAELEKKWRQSIENRLTWLIWLASHMYEILFFAAAVLTVFGFFKATISRKQRYADEDDDYYDDNNYDDNNYDDNNTDG